MQYKIGTVAWHIGVDPQTLRNWEREKLIPSPKRRMTGMRLYSEEDVEAIRLFALERWQKRKNGGNERREYQEYKK